ncbi:HAD family hydrolase, partial [bacterium]|nr:HAD family hydrolase [bacterium]
MRGIRGVIFDFDGTIVSLHIDFGEIKKRIVEKALLSDLKIPNRNLPLLEFLEEVKRRNRGKKEFEDFYKFACKYLKEKELEASEKSTPFPEGLKLLENLKSKGLKIGIITRNCKEAVEKVINKFNIPYDILLTRDDVEKVKPDEIHLKEAIKRLGLKKKEVIMVGDHKI